jgi:hypothetical protein
MARAVSSVALRRGEEVGDAQSAAVRGASARTRAGYPRGRSMALPAMVIAMILAVAALLDTVGADARWLAALGRVIVTRHGIPAGVPFASAPSVHWPNALVLAELLFNGLERGLGDRGLMLAQLLAVGFGLAVLARDALADGATANGTAAALLLAALGALPSLVIDRVQLFSLALFPLLVALLRSEARRPSRRIWLVVGVLALWSNLHGAALVGLLVTLAYLLLHRSRQEPRTAAAVAVAATIALGLTPAFTGALTYYHGVLTNVAAQRGAGLWAPLSLSAPFDDVAILAAIALAWFLRRNRPRLWELAVILGLAALSVQASRSAVWLLLFLVAPAARSIAVRREWGHLIPLTIAASLATIAFAIGRGPLATRADRTLVSRAVTLARGTPVLASDLLGEEVALDGGRILIGNPIDAFSRHDQATYIDWLQGARGGTAALVPEVRIVLVNRGSATERLMATAPSFAPVAGDRATILYERTR